MVNNAGSIRWEWGPRPRIPIASPLTPVTSPLPLVGPFPLFSHWAEALWFARTTISNLVKSPEFINHHWTIGKEGSFTEYYFCNSEGKAGPFVRVNDSNSEIFFGHYLRGSIEGPTIQMKFGISYTQGCYVAGKKEGQFLKVFHNQETHKCQFSRGLLHGEYIRETPSERETIPFVNGRMEGWAKCTNQMGDTRTRLWQGNILLEERIADARFPNVSLVKHPEESWYLEWYLKDQGRDLPFEWYLESLAKNFAQFKQSPFSKLPRKEEALLHSYPQAFQPIEQGAKLWLSIDENIRKQALDILRTGYAEEKGNEIRRSQSWEIAILNNNLLIKLTGSSSRKKVELTLDILKNAVFFSSQSDEAYAYYAGSCPHFEKETPLSQIVQHRITYLDRTVYFQTVKGLKQGTEYILKLNRDRISIDRSPQLESTTITNPLWPEVTISIQRQSKEPEQGVLQWVPTNPPARTSVIAFLEALFAPPQAAPTIPSPVVVEPPAAAGLDALVRTVLKRSRSSEELEQEKIVGIESRTLIWDHKQALVLNIELNTSSKNFASYIEEARQKLANLKLTARPTGGADRELFAQKFIYPKKLQKEITHFLFGEEEKVQQILEAWQEHSFRIKAQDLVKGTYFFVTLGENRGFYIKKNRYYAHGDVVEGKRQGNWTYLAPNGNTATKEFTPSKPAMHWAVLAEQNSQVEVREISDEPLDLKSSEAKYTGVIVWKHKSFPRFVVSQTFTDGKADSPPILRCKFSKLDGLEGKPLSAQVVRAMEILTK